MSILERMRRSTDSATARIFFGLLVLFFIFWGAGGTGGIGNESQVLATVDGTRITNTQLYREMRLRNLGAQGTSEEESARLRAALLEQLVQEEMLVQEAERLGIVVSDQEVLRVKVYTEAFSADGEFSVELYERQLKRMGLKPDRYEEMIRRDLMRQKLLSVVLQGARVSEADVQRAYDQQNTMAELQWVKIPETALMDDVAVQDAEVDAFLANNELKVKERYDQDYERVYKAPRKAAFSAILLRSDLAGTEPATLRQRAVQVQEMARATDEAGFAELARRYSEDLSASNGGSMGLMPEPLMDPPLASAIFAAGAGQVSEIAETGRGLWVLRVSSVEEARDTPFEEVKRAIARDLVAEQGVGKKTQEYAENVLAAWKAAQSPPTDLLAQQGLEVESTGSQSLAVLSVPELGDNAGLLDAARSAKGTGVLPGVYPTPGGWVVGAVSAWTPADPSGYEAEKERLRMMVLASVRGQYFESWLEDLKKRSKVERLQDLGAAS